MKNSDQSQRFLFEDHPIRGQHVSLDQSWQEIAQQGELEGRGLSLLGEALVVVALLVDTLKIEGSVTLQIRGTGPLELLVVEANSKHGVRGTARQVGEIDEQADLQQIFGSDVLVITIKAEGAEPHQGIAPLRGINLSDALEYYFATSEQLPTHFCLACDAENASGMLIQKLPGKLTDDDAWDRVLHLASTVTDDELQRLALGELLHRLFNEETLRLFDSHTIKFSCSCSRERTAAMLLSLGKAEASEILETEGEISVSCEFCSTNYSFDQIDVDQVFGEGGTVPPSATTH
ncbi:MAG: Hsp33 family molecular chaperone HslO [Gammaproteobacteria bacterium]|jgi:molecular chaperone Hsp33|nr:Hsp33 family molecular chaperone HslO [Gammaproteobacteria bacterium]